MKTSYYLSERANQEFSAGSKARNDIDDIFSKMDLKKIYVQPCRSINNINELFTNPKVLRNNWKEISKQVDDEDIIIMQYPFGAYFGSYTINTYNIRKLKDRGIRFIALVHDLVHLQEPLLVRKTTEVSLLEEYDILIVHNNKMKDKLVNYGIDENKIICLGIFDYLSLPTKVIRNKDQGISVAGNLMKRKAGYVYKLANQITIPFNLYGPNYDGITSSLVNYHGSLPPEELIEVIEGAYGLIWDGPDLDGCNGPYGKYQKLNNPHRVSMCLAASLPIIINSQAALSSFVEEKGIGLVVDSLEDIDSVLNQVSEEKYKQMLENTKEISQMIRQGIFTTMAVKKAFELLGE